MQIEYDRKVLLGQGGYGSVFLGKYKGVKVAVKRIQLHNVNDNEEKALQCLHQFGHPNIVQLIYSELVTDFKLFALEFCAASLDQLFLNPQNYDGFKLPHHLTVFRQLASGLAFIHSNGLFHRDIKPQNVLISIDSFTELVTIKWADFGLSKFVNERGTCTLSGIKGTDDYFAPELLRSQGKSEGPGRGTIKSDVFSFALVIGYLLLDGQHLYGANYDIPVNIMNKSPVNMGKIDRSHFARDLLDLLTKMLEDDPNKRISSIQVVNELETIIPAGGKKKSKEPKPRKASYHYQVIECDFCPMRYYTWSAFYFHRCTHTGETPVIPCSVCEMEFPNIKALKEHKIMEHREAIFPCEGCNRTFLSKSALLLHQPIHSNDFNYQCRSCPEKMRTFRERYVHERTHSTTEEPQTPQQKLVL